MQGPLRDVYQAALGLGTANQLTNILRDVGEDITERNRIYVPTQELKEFGIAESEVSVRQRSDSAPWYSVVLVLTAQSMVHQQASSNQVISMFFQLSFYDPSPFDSAAIVIPAFTVQPQAHQPLLLVGKVWHRWTVD